MSLRIPEGLTDRQTKVLSAVFLYPGSQLKDIAAALQRAYQPETIGMIWETTKMRRWTMAGLSVLVSFGYVDKKDDRYYYNEEW